MVRVLLSVVSLILVAAAAGAQVPTGTISGRVVSRMRRHCPARR